MRASFNRRTPLKAFTILAVSTAALALTACSDQQDETPITQEAADDMDVAVPADDAMPAGGQLDETQQASYDAMDRRAVSDEYDANQDAMMAGNSGATDGGNTMATDANTSGNPTTTGTSMSGSANTTASDTGSAASSGTGAADQATPLRARSQMDFAYLDRNSDGRLSVAEYAIWAVRADPDTPVANDRTKPYISTEQINEAGQTFFYFDEDGDTYLSDGEFTAARNSARTPGGSSM